MIRTIEVHGERRFKSGYLLRHETWEGAGGPPVKMKSCYNFAGDYIGGVPWGHRLCTIRGIKPEKLTPQSNVCSVGFCEKDQKWYGWSHRAIFGFGVGSIVKSGDCTAESGWTEEYLKENPGADMSLPVGFQAKTLEDAKRMAIAFAESVS